MSTYATQADCEAGIPGLVVNDPTAFALVIEQAERDVDGLLGPGRPKTATGLKVTPSDHPDWVAGAIMRATVRQVEWLILQTAEALAGSVPVPLASVKGPEFEEAYAVSATTRPEAPALIGRRVAEELRPRAPYIARTALPRS